MVSELS